MNRLGFIFLQYRFGRGGGMDMGDMFEYIEYIGVFLGIVVCLIVVSIVVRGLRKFLSKGKNTSNTTFMTPRNMGLRGKTKEQKQVVKYFISTGILGMVFRISNSTFDSLLNKKADEVVSNIENRALEAHGMDADEVREISPILTEGYYPGSRYFKMFRDQTFRASEYQMTYLMFSEKQIYAYSYLFDLTSKNTTEQTKEYFYEDITSVEVTTTQNEFSAPRLMKHLIAGIVVIIFGLLMMVSGEAIAAFFGFFILILGVIVAVYQGYSLHVVENLIMRLTVAGDEFVCAMKPENIAAIQGMKAKIREKKR